MRSTAFGNKKAPQPDDADCGEVQHLAEPSGQLNLLEWNSNEPPEPDDFPGDLEGFKTAYLDWVSNQLDNVQEEHEHVDIEDIWNQSGNRNPESLPSSDVIKSAIAYFCCSKISEKTQKGRRLTLEEMQKMLRTDKLTQAHNE